MTNYLLRRLLESVPLLVLVSALVFGMLQASPGSPLAQLERDPTISQGDLERIARERGLLDPAPVQYVRWVRGAVRGDFGRSLQTGRPVTREILDRLPNTVTLVATAFVVTLLIAIPVGVLSAVRQYSWFDHLVTAFAFMGQSIPIFWLGLMLILVFYFWLPNPFGAGPLFPPGGMSTTGLESSLADRAWHLILPVAMLSSTWVAWYTRFLRASMIETLSQDFVRTARAKGMPERRVIYRHALRNAALPLVTLVALDLPMVFSGALFTETIFSWPGMGRLFFQSALRRDYPVLMAIVMVTSMAIVVANLLADLAYAYVDPRIRYD